MTDQKTQHAECASLLSIKLAAEHEALTLMVKDFCKEIGCSGISPDMCRNHPFDCSIVKKVMGG